MLHVPSSVAIYVYTRHADLRKGFDGLSGIVRQEFQADRWTAVCFCSSTAAATG